MVSWILHMSDLHLGKNPALERERLLGLAKWLEGQEFGVDHLVFTGDLIDAPTVLLSCVRKLKREYPDRFSKLRPVADTDAVLAQVEAAGPECISLYNAQIREATLHSMEQGGSLFCEFIDRIGVERSHVILCCGNHDRIRFAGEGSFDCGTDHRVDEEGAAAPFEAYDRLCRMVNSELSHFTQVYTRDGVSFVITNSNWRSPTRGESNCMCVNCGVLAQKLDELQKTAGFQRTGSLLVAHKPYDDLCEDFKYPYAGQRLTVGEMVERTVAACLCGDKHAFSVKMNCAPKQFLCGAPISGPRVRYNLLDFAPDVGVRACSYLLNDGSGWFRVPIADCQEAVYDASKPYLKGYAFDLLARSRSVSGSWVQAVALMEEARDRGALDSLSELFASFCELRRDASALEIGQDTFFSQLTELIEGSQRQALSIKGRPGVGKSTFVTVLYLYMLCLFSAGKTRYMPFYFNFDRLATQSADYSVEEYIAGCRACFSEYFSHCLELSRQHGRPLCLFLDGLEKSKVLDTGNDTVEKRAYQLLESQLDAADRYVMCFNTHDAYDFDDTFEKIARFSHVLFMNRARVLPYKDDEGKLDCFLRAYLSLTGRGEDGKLARLKDSLTKFRFPSVDLFFLDHCDRHIFGIREDEETWAVLRGHLADLEQISDRLFGVCVDPVQRAAGLLFSRRKCYTEIIASYGEEDKPTISDFLALLNAPDVANYLTAQFFVQELSRYGNLDSAIPGDSILHSFIPHELALLVRLILDQKGSAAGAILARFIERHGGELGGSYLYSTLAYLCGHLRSESAADLMDRLPEPEEECAGGFFALCNRRSRALAQSIHDAGSPPPVETMLLELLDNAAYRRFNRAYQLHYYQDRSSNRISNQIPWGADCVPVPGFDFRYTFLILLSKLEPVLQKWKSPYPLMQLDLFTLCDLIYSRLQAVGPKGFFYSAKYNGRGDSECEAVLNRITGLLKGYLDLYSGSGSEKVGAYFSLMYVRLDRVRRAVSANKGRDVDVSYVSPCVDFEQVLRLSELARVGWNIDKADSVKVEAQPSYRRNPRTGATVPPIWESMMQHVMESVYIAQLFLPDELPEEKGFQKPQVIALLLLSELGKIPGGDYSPEYTNSRTRQSAEKAELARVALLGALDGYAVQPALFQTLSSDDSPTETNLRICWEIKLIQREYKYYCLYEKLGFTPERRAAFEKDFKEPTTDICRSIRKQLVLDNPAFQKFAPK